MGQRQSARALPEGKQTNQGIFFGLGRTGL